MINSSNGPSSLARGDGPRVAFFSAFWGQGPQIVLGASDWWRLAMPACRLYEQGWDVIFARNIATGDDGRLQIQDPMGTWHNDRDVIVWQRWMGKGAAEKVVNARNAGQTIIQDVDDHYWAIPEKHLAHKVLTGDGLENYNELHYRELISASSLIVVTTDYLHDELTSWGPPIRQIPNYIDLDYWPEVTPPGDYVGWVGAMPWRGNDLEILRETVVPWLRARNQFFYHGGHMAGTRTVKEALGYDLVSIRPATDVEHSPSLWDPLRVCLIPIDPTPFGLSKSWIKPLEACARGIPFIASDHPEYRKLGVGRLVEKPEDWVRHLEELEDPEVYAEECLRNRARAEELSIQQHWTVWADLLKEFAPSRPLLHQKKPNRFPRPQALEIALNPDIQARLELSGSKRLFEEQKFILHWTATEWDGKHNILEIGNGFEEPLAIGMEMNQASDGRAVLRRAFTPGSRYSFIVVSGSDSWSTFRHLLLDICPYMSVGSHLLLADFTDPVQFWLPMAVAFLGEFFSPTSYCASTYGFKLQKMLDAEDIARILPKEPTDVTRETYSKWFDHLMSHANFRDDRFGFTALCAQRGAAFSTIGTGEEAVEVINGLLDRVEFLPFRKYLEDAREQFSVVAT